MDVELHKMDFRAIKSFPNDWDSKKNVTHTWLMQPSEIILPKLKGFWAEQES